MTTIEHGGGPTIEQKRAFSGLREGAHLPGYVLIVVSLIYSCSLRFNFWWQFAP